jgi:hypothetical protein
MKYAMLASSSTLITDKACHFTMVLLKEFERQAKEVSKPEQT